MRVRNWLFLPLILGLSLGALKNCPVERMGIKAQTSPCGHCAKASKPISKNFLCCTQPGDAPGHVQALSLDGSSANPLFTALRAGSFTPDFAVHSLKDIESAASPPRASPLRLTPRAPPA